MDQLENQVSDLRYLTTAITPMAADAESALGSPSSQLNSANSALYDHRQQPSVAGTKRKSIDDSSPSAANNGKQPRSKRNRYISIACNECKRRKIKCNGETPCQRCGNLNLQCLYAPNCCSTSFKDSDDFRQMTSTVARLQEQVETLFNNMSALRSEALRLAPMHDRGLPAPAAMTATTPTSSASLPAGSRPTLPHVADAGFRGPTSAHFNLDIAKNTLHKLGYSNVGAGSLDGGPSGSVDTPNLSPTLAPQVVEIPAHHRSVDPLWDYDKDEIIRLCRIHEEEINVIYPVCSVESVIKHAKFLVSCMDAVRRGTLVQDLSETMNDAKSLLLKVIMCIGLVVEEHGNSVRANRLFESLRPTADKLLMSDPSDVAYLPFLVLVGAYRFLANEEILCWRTIGQVARYCIELGLHRRHTIGRIQDDEVRRNAIHSFWTAYILDRRWSFATGLPYVLQDGDIDSHLPPPDEFPFLRAMVSYTRVSSKVWQYLRNFDQPTMDLQPGELESLDQQIQQWYTGAPSDAQLDLADWDSMPRYLNPPHGSQREYDIQRQQIWTYLRLNQMRIWLYTPVLHTHSSIMENLGLAERAVRLAKNTITYLTHLHNTTSLYRRSQVFYHQFLSPAIAVLFLASCHAPVNFSSSCRDEFYMALELVKDMSAKSDASRRLWRAIRSLKEVAPRLGLSQEEDLHSSAALTMAGLATGHISQNDANARNAATTPGFGGGGRAPPQQQQQQQQQQQHQQQQQQPPQQVAGAAPSTGSLSPSVQPNGWQISSEMSKIFEGYMGLNGFDERAAAAAAAAAASASDIRPLDDDGGGGPPPAFGVGMDRHGSMYQHFRDLL